MESTDLVLSATQRELDIAKARLAELERLLALPKSGLVDQLSRRFIEQSGDIYTLSDAQGRRFYVSETITPVLGYTPAEYIALSNDSIFHPDDMVKVAHITQMLLSAPNTKHTMEVRLLHKDGRWVWFEINVINLIDQPETKAYSANYRDITKRKDAELQSQQSEAQYRQIVETSQEGIWIIDAESKTSFVNRKMGELLGYSPEEMLGRPLFSFMDEVAQKIASNNVKRRQEGITEQHEFRFKRKDGTDLWTLMSTNPLQNETGGYEGALAMVTDITGRKKSELEIILKNRDLETLLHITSHDLREPLRAIRNFSQIIADQYHDSLDSRGQDFLARIIRGADRMDRLIDDILKLSRAQRTVSPSTHINGKEILAEVFNLLEPKIGSSGAIITVIEPLPELYVDKAWAVQAIYNLLINAIKFSLPDTPPEIQIAGYQSPQNSAELGFVIRDRGIGISNEYAERIFGLFQRAVGREVEGTGAGLAIVREVAERHNGHAWAQPRQGGGSEFFVTFSANLS